MVTATVPCWSCGDPCEITIEDGVVDYEHYGSPMVVRKDKVEDETATVEEHFDQDLDDDMTVIVYVECDECCWVCNDEGT